MSPIARYHRLLAKVSRRFAAIAARRRGAIACRAGCFGCCVGLFEISALDAAVAARGLAKLPRARRDAIAKRGESIARRIAGVFPGDTATLLLDPGREDAWDGFFEKTAAIACPFLEPDGKSGESAPAAARRKRWPQGFSCAIYADRPHACRTFGLPLAERGTVVSEPCRLNFRGAAREEIAAAALPVYEPEEDRIARDAEAQLGLPVDAATILPAVAAGRFPPGATSRRRSGR